jgi:hypothetical protein
MLVRFLVAVAAVAGISGCSQPPISPSWADLSFDVDAPDTTSGERWSGFVDYCTPVQLDESTVAILERRMGIEIALWHVDIAEGTLHFIVVLNEGITTPSGFDEFVLHREGSDIFAEFILVHTTQTTSNRFAGHSLIGEINLRTGATKVKKDKVKHVSSEEVARQKLLDKRRSGSIVPDIATHKVKGLVAQSLAKRGLSFDYNRGRFALAAEDRVKLGQAVLDLNKSGTDMLANIIALQRTLNDLPSCPATRELARQLSSAVAIAR